MKKMSLAWNWEKPPVFFLYDGKDSKEFLREWKHEEDVSPCAGGEMHVHQFRDTKTNLCMTAEVRTFDEFAAVEWVLRFKNEGTGDTGIIEEIKPLNYDLATEPKDKCRVYYSRGSDCRINDFEPITTEFGWGRALHLSSSGGRSSNGRANGALPFFNIQDGDSKGIIMAIGWTGNWDADFTQEKNGNVNVRAGMQKTYLRLHPGEEIRTPRILLLGWEGDVIEAHNIWRQLILKYYTPQVNGEPLKVPTFTGHWGEYKPDWHIDKVRRLKKNGIAVDVLWIDAGWYGNAPFREILEGANVMAASPWNGQVGNWQPNKAIYPNGFGSVKDTLRELGMGFLLWVEPERAWENTEIVVKHPEWFLRLQGNKKCLLNLGMPEARKGITELISKLIKDAGLTWYRQDFNMDPESYWKEADEPERIGITEIRHIEGLYKFWDDLRARHPGLQIDNCSSGGRRIDLETISRSVSLWRSDYQGNPGWDLIGLQGQTHGLAFWVPLSTGVCTRKDTYAFRTALGPGIVVTPGMIEQSAAEWLRKMLEEHKQVRECFYGDFYPLLSYNTCKDTWAAWQFDCPDIGKGFALFLRRQECPFETMHACLKSIDTGAEYEVDIRIDDNVQKRQRMAGAELSNTKISIPSKPGSALVLYSRV